jgi:hypothetical protein
LYDPTKIDTANIPMHGTFSLDTTTGEGCWAGYWANTVDDLHSHNTKLKAPFKYTTTTTTTTTSATSATSAPTNFPINWKGEVLSHQQQEQKKWMPRERTHRTSEVVKRFDFVPRQNEKGNEVAGNETAITYDVRIVGDNQYGSFVVTGTLVVLDTTTSTTSTSTTLTGPLEAVKRYTQMWSPHTNIRPKQMKISNPNIDTTTTDLSSLALTTGQVVTIQYNERHVENVDGIEMVEETEICRVGILQTLNSKSKVSYNAEISIVWQYVYDEDESQLVTLQRKTLSPKMFEKTWWKGIHSDGTDHMQKYGVLPSVFHAKDYDKMTDGELRVEDIVQPGEYIAADVYRVKPKLGDRFGGGTKVVVFVREGGVDDKQEVEEGMHCPPNKCYELRCYDGEFSRIKHGFFNGQNGILFDDDGAVINTRMRIQQRKRKRMERH